MSRRVQSSEQEDDSQHLESGPVRISSMRLEDLPEVARLERLCFAKPWSQSVFVHEFENPLSQTLVARSGGADPRLVGYICRWVMDDEVHILNIAVHPQIRRLGVGRRLLMRVLREARARQASVVWLEVRRGNSAAYWLYRRAGFVEVGVRRHYYGRGEDAVVMRLIL